MKPHNKAYHPIFVCIEAAANSSIESMLLYAGSSPNRSTHQEDLTSGSVLYLTILKVYNIMRFASEVNVHLRFCVSGNWNGYMNIANIFHCRHDFGRVISSITIVCTHFIVISDGGGDELRIRMSLSVDYTVVRCKVDIGCSLNCERPTWYRSCVMSCATNRCLIWFTNQKRRNRWSGITNHFQKRLQNLPLYNIQETCLAYSLPLAQ